jgi:ATP diphosphatase
MAQEAGLFTFDDVANAISEKMIRRHPHVFGPMRPKAPRAEQKARWEVIKAAGAGRRRQEQEGAGRRARPACPPWRGRPS